jgi:hypothetical protein
MTNCFRKLLFEETPTRSTANIRNKRGLPDVLGYGLKYLFGTADSRDVKRLVKVCDELHAFETRMVHATEYQVTYIRTLDEMRKQNMMDTVELARTLRESIYNFSLQFN